MESIVIPFEEASWTAWAPSMLQYTNALGPLLATMCLTALAVQKKSSKSLVAENAALRERIEELEFRHNEVADLQQEVESLKSENEFLVALIGKYTAVTQNEGSQTESESSTPPESPLPESYDAHDIQDSILSTLETRGGRTAGQLATLLKPVFPNITKSDVNKNLYPMLTEGKVRKNGQRGLKPVWSV
jgi:hypothetical protein